MVHKGTTPVLTPDQTRALFDSIDTSTLIGPRDRALIAVMAHTFARIGAVVAMRVADYRANDERWWVRLHEKGCPRLGKNPYRPCTNLFDTGPDVQFGIFIGHVAPDAGNDGVTKVCQIPTRVFSKRGCSVILSSHNGRIDDTGGA